ncbi:MAG: LysR family transcriptional regulator [Pseudomonadota bacterium]
MELPSQMVLFAQVVQAGSFSSTARHLGQSPSAVSRQIGHLEDRVGVRLLNRTKHGLSVTEAGQKFYEKCSDVSKILDEAETFAATLDDHPKGLLKIASTVAFGKAQLLPILPEFIAQYPDIELSVELTDRRLDIAEENLDLAIRFTEQLENQDVIRRKLAANNRLICASPVYLEKYGAPESLSELEKHNCLQVTTVPEWNDWGSGNTHNTSPLSLSGNFRANSADGIYHAALAGIGIARLSTYLISEDLRTGRLVQLFPDYVDAGSEIVAIYSEKRNLSAKVRALIDHLVLKFANVPPWEK